MSQEDFQKKYAVEKVENIFGSILTECMIDSSLSNEDILKCAKITSLLTKYMRGNVVKEAEIWIYAFPEVNQYVLLKLITQEDVLDLVNNKDFIGVIIKEGDLFCVKNPNFKLYFQILEENDSSMKIYYDKLKSL